jgi:hypothetical protein
VFHQELDGGVAAERLLPREHLEEQHPERVEVRAPVDRLARELLGRDVARRAAHRPRGRHRRVHRCVEGARDPEVEHARALALPRRALDHHVLALEIAP